MIKYDIIFTQEDIIIMAYFHHRRWIWIRIRMDSCTMQDFSTGSDSDSDPLIEMYGIGMEICPWDGDPSLKWVQ